MERLRNGDSSKEIDRMAKKMRTQSLMATLVRNSHSRRNTAYELLKRYSQM